jgi:hypothetical protein
MRVRGLTGGPDADVVYGFLNASVAIRFLGWASGKEIVFKCSLKVFFISLVTRDSGFFLKTSRISALVSFYLIKTRAKSLLLAIHETKAGLIWPES